MLKNELQKTLDKQKQLEAQLEKGNAEKESELVSQIKTLENQMNNLRQDFEDKQMEQKLQIDTLESEL